MNKIVMSMCGFIGLSLYAMTPAAKHVAEDKKEKLTPNVVVILADDLGYGDLQCYNSNSQISTPALDKLSKEGLRFIDAHSGSSVCTPTRYGLVTGRYAFRSSLKEGVLYGYSPSLIESSRYCIGDMFKECGYETAVIGKWHLGLDWKTKEGSGANLLKIKVGEVDFTKKVRQGPNDVGFDFSYIIPGSLDMSPYVFLQNGKPVVTRIVPIQGSQSPRGNIWRAGERDENFILSETLNNISAKAEEYLVARSKTSKPFFLYLPITSPHTPWLPGARFKNKSEAGTYGDFVANTDYVVGNVIRTLDSLNLRENTIIVFTSDNGAHWTSRDKNLFPKHNANDNLTGMKSDIWEGGHRVPFIVRWPAKIKSPGRIVNQTICLTDLMSTFASILGKSLPSNSAQDSFDFSPVLVNEKYSKAIRQNIIHHSITGMFAIRQGDWKYVDGQGSGGWSIDSSKTKDLNRQLYNLKKDPQERSNEVEKNPRIANELALLLNKQKSEGFSRKGAQN